MFFCMKKISSNTNVQIVFWSLIATILIVLLHLVFYFLCLFVFALFLLMIIDGFFLFSIIGGAIYIPTKMEKVNLMIKLAQIKSGQKAVDLGSGDGRIVIALSKAGVIADGYEINPMLVLRSRLTLRRFKLSAQSKIYWHSFWLCNFHDYDLVTLFGIPYIMGDLEKKLKHELKPGSKVICNAFPFPHWQPIQVEDEVYVYQVGEEPTTKSQKN